MITGALEGIPWMGDRDIDQDVFPRGNFWAGRTKETIGRGQRGRESDSLSPEVRRVSGWWNGKDGD